jgi:hypothetical protein
MSKQTAPKTGKRHHYRHYRCGKDNKGTLEVVRRNLKFCRNKLESLDEIGALF